MGLLRSILVLVGAALLLYGGVRAWMWTRVRERRLGPPRIRSTEPADLPALLASTFEAAEAALAPLGFTPVGARWVESIDVCEGPRPERAFSHPMGTLAFVGPPRPGDGERPWRVTFVSRLAEGPVVATFDGVTGVTGGFPPGWRCSDRDVRDPERQWADHLRSLDAVSGRGAVEQTSLDAWNRLERRAMADTLRDWEVRGRTRRTGDPEGRRPRWRFRTLTAWRLGCRLLRGQRRTFAREADAARERSRKELWRSDGETRSEGSTPTRDTARAAAMAWAYQYERAACRCRAERRTARREIAGALAAGAACLVGLGLWLGPAVAGVVAGVLALHELGHVAGTAWLGDRAKDGPSSGGGSGMRSAPVRRAIVALLGPVPGLVLGLAALHLHVRGGGDAWLLVGVVALLVNYVNLLPILPLDGGRMVDALLLDRYPRAQVAFLAAGAAAAGLAAWVLGELVLAALALALVVSLRVARSAARALRRTREAIHPRMTESDRVLALFETLQEPPYAAMPVARRQRIAEVIAPHLCGRAASRRATLAGAAVYAALLLGVPAAVSAGIASHRPAGAGAAAEGERPGEPGPAWGVVRRDGRTAPRVSGDAHARIPEGPETTQSSAARISEASLVGR